MEYIGIDRNSKATSPILEIGAVSMPTLYFVPSKCLLILTNYLVVIYMSGYQHIMFTYIAC
jgi:hypothetical protein